MSDPTTGIIIEDVPCSDLVGPGHPAEIGSTETRRARAVVEVIYVAEPDEFVDVGGMIFNALSDCGGDHIHRDLGAVIVNVDLTEHVRFVEKGSSPPAPKHGAGPPGPEPIPSTRA